MAAIGEPDIDKTAGVDARRPTGLRRLRLRILHIGPQETSFARRGFAVCAPATRRELEQHGTSFVDGFNLAVGARGVEEFDDLALSVPPAERGFAYEGAAMAFGLLDLVVLGRGRRVGRLLDGAGSAHVYMVHVGVGWALARLRLRPWGRLSVLDPLLRWLAVDGYGFHEGFFKPADYVRQRKVCRRLSGYSLRVFDQGLGRSLWFVEAADVGRVAQTIATFADERRADLWSGVGLAASYAGGVEGAELELLGRLAGPFRPQVAQGAAFAATARIRAGNVVAHTEAACRELCGVTAHEAAAVVDAALRGIVADAAGAGYERWRTRIAAQLAAPRVTA